MTTKKILKKRKERAKALNLTICPQCGYCNQKFNVENYGTCTGCGYVLDKRIKMFYEVRKKANIKKINSID